jgi:TonB family protein
VSHDWKQWEGQVVSGEFPLLQYLGGSEHSAVFLTEFHEGGLLLRAAIKLIPAPQESGEPQLARWRLAGELSHPHLISLFDAGQCELGGMPLLYLVMECAEENLAQVLASRTLTPAETREMLDSILDVLAYLHSKGFVHGHIKPINIMANGDQLKLSSDGLRRTGEPLERSGRLDEYDPLENEPGATAPTETTSPAGDVWSLGMTLVETLTRTLPVTQTTEQREPLVPLTLPEPFLDIARHCLLRRPQDRWTVAQIAIRLQDRVPAHQIHTPVRPPLVTTTRPPMPRAKRQSYGIPLVAGIVLALVASLALPRLLHHHAEAPPAAAAALEQPVPPAPKQPIQARQEPPAKASKEDVVEDEQDSEGPTAEPALVHPETLHEETTNTAAMLPAGAIVHGEVAQQVLPDIIKSARDTIRGTVKVSVKVDVDRSGNVEGAELESRGPSKYFARAALQAAPLWKFQPPKVGGRGVLSSWTLRFEFTRGGTTVIPRQEIP